MNRRQFITLSAGVVAMAGAGGLLAVGQTQEKSISLWGHSFFGNNDTFSSKLIAETGYPVYNFGLSGATSESIALRNGAYSIRYEPESMDLKAGVKNPLIPNVPGPLRLWGNAPADWIHLPCEMYGVSGVLDWDGKNIFFTASNSIKNSKLDKPSVLTIYPMTTVGTGNVAEKTRYPEHPGSIYLLWLGRNNSTQPEEIMRDAKAIVSRMWIGNNRFVILPEFPASYEHKGTKGAEEIAHINRLYKESYPENYCEIEGVDLLQNFMNHHNPQSQQDLADIKVGITPSSLRADELHPSITKKDGALFAGTEVNAEFVAKFLKLKGWV